MKVNTPYFGTHIDLGNTLKYDDLTGFDTYVKRISVQIADTTDKLIMDAITRIAIEEGITDLYVLDKQNIVAALKKQIPEKVKYLDRHGAGYDYWNKDYYNCTACGRRLRNKQHDPYCPRCGQALDWGDEDNV